MDATNPTEKTRMKSIFQAFNMGSEAFEEAERIASSEFGELVAAISDDETNIFVWLDRLGIAIQAATCRFQEGDVDDLSDYERALIERWMMAYLIRQTELARLRWPGLAPGEPYNWDDPKWA